MKHTKTYDFTGNGRKEITLIISGGASRTIQAYSKKM